MTKVTAVFALVLSTASILVIASPRPAQAEGFLLDTVRCLVRTVLITGCDPTTAPAPAPASSDQPQEQSSAPSREASSSASRSQAKRSQTALQAEPVATPEMAVQDYPAFQEVARAGSGDRMTEAEYIAYFNAHSPYAVQGAQHSAGVEGALVQAGPEGWKLFGVAWYWWAAVAALLFGLFLSVKHGVLRMPSVLSGGK